MNSSSIERGRRFIECFKEAHYNEKLVSSWYDEWRFSASPVKKVFSFGKYNIGAEFLPGDKRHGKVLKDMGYGHIRKMKGADGMAMDCYFTSDCLDLEGSNYKKMFKIKQIKEDGSFDELKYMLGWKTKEDAKKAYLSVMPKKLFGGIS